MLYDDAVHSTNERSSSVNIFRILLFSISLMIDFPFLKIFPFTKSVL